MVDSNRSGLLYTAAATTAPPGWNPKPDAGIYRSEDGGRSWTHLTQGLPTQFDDMVRPITLDEAGNVFAAAGSQLFGSKDAGETWQLLADGLPPVRAIIA